MTNVGGLGTAGTSKGRSVLSCLFQAPRLSWVKMRLQGGRIAVLTSSTIRWHVLVVAFRRRTEGVKSGIRRTDTIDGDEVAIAIRTSQTLCLCWFVVAFTWGT